MRTDYGNDTDFWEYFGALWGCERLFTDPVKDPSPAPLGGGVIIVDMPNTPRYEEPRHPHLAHNANFDPDQTQRIVIAWEGEGNDNDIQ